MISNRDEFWLHYAKFKEQHGQPKRRTYKIRNMPKNFCAIIKNYYPFWLGLIVTITLIGALKDYPSIATVLAFILGFFKVTKFHKD